MIHFSQLANEQLLGYDRTRFGTFIIKQHGVSAHLKTHIGTDLAVYNATPGSVRNEMGHHGTLSDRHGSYTIKRSPRIP